MEAVGLLVEHAARLEDEVRRRTGVLEDEVIRLRTEGAAQETAALRGELVELRPAGGKTLYEQLEAEREKQQEAYDANTKALFSPGEVLDAEDVAFYMVKLEQHQPPFDQRSP